MDKQAEIDKIMREYAAKNREIEMDHFKNMARIGLGSVLSGASAHPFFNIPYIGTGIGGAMYDLGQGIVEGDKINDLVKRAARGFAIGETAGAIPYVGKLAGKTKAGQAIGEAVEKAGEKFAQSKAYDVLMSDIKAFNPNRQTVYHGSPADFNKFDNAYIGTGEGAQAHGYGHYAANSKDVADRYRQNLSDDIDTFDDIGTRIKVGDRAYNKVATNTFRGEPQDVTSVFFDEGIDDSLNKAINYYNNFKGDKNKALSFVQNKIDNAIENRDYSTGADFVRIKEALQGNDFELLYKAQPNQGQLYKLSIPKDDVMLREDELFNYQPQKVQDILWDIAFDESSKGNRELLEVLGKNKSGKEIYETIWDTPNTNGIYGNKGASKLLSEKGIKGISYNGGIDGEANVIFNPDDIEIVRKYYNQPSLKDLYSKFINAGAYTSAATNP